jgi:prefoldin subunit 5
MEGTKSLEQEVKALQRQMGGIARLVKDLKSIVENLEKRGQISESREIQEIIDT